MTEDYHWAIKTGDLDSVKDFVENQSMSARNADSSVRRGTPLHYAADFGQVGVAEYLISKGADVNVKDAFGITPLLTASYEGHPDMVELLLKHGADKTIKDKNGKCAFETAHDDKVKALLA